MTRPLNESALKEMALSSKSKGLLVFVSGEIYDNILYLYLYLYLFIYPFLTPTTTSWYYKTKAVFALGKKMRNLVH